MCSLDAFNVRISAAIFLLTNDIYNNNKNDN